MQTNIKRFDQRRNYQPNKEYRYTNNYKWKIHEFPQGFPLNDNKPIKKQATQQWIDKHFNIKLSELFCIKRNTIQKYSSPIYDDNVHTRQNSDINTTTDNNIINWLVYLHIGYDVDNCVKVDIKNNNNNLIPECKEYKYDVNVNACMNDLIFQHNYDAFLIDNGCESTHSQTQNQPSLVRSNLNTHLNDPCPCMLLRYGMQLLNQNDYRNTFTQDKLIRKILNHLDQYDHASLMQQYYGGNHCKFHFEKVMITNHNNKYTYDDNYGLNFDKVVVIIITNTAIKSVHILNYKEKIVQ